ncbi:MAG: hypothetical protein J6O41_00435, partial [Clostridia bacterium]|nr:hypothetical protein [Clostridia bacterium]
MNKKIIMLIVLVIAIIAIGLIFLIPKNEEINNESEIYSNVNENKVESMETMYIKVNNKILDVELEDNSATKELKEKIQNGDIIVHAKE